MIRQLFLLCLLCCGCTSNGVKSKEQSSPSDHLNTLEEAREYFYKPLSAAKEPIHLLNVSYDPTRSLYEEVNQTFSRWWEEKTGQKMAINQSHGGSGKQARSIVMGLEADVATLALAYDIDVISKLTGWLPEDWADRLPNRSVPLTSTVVFLVRKGNPKQIKDWDDLAKEGVSVIMPNPKTSGGARWNYLAAWGYASEKYNGDQQKTKEFIKKIFSNVPMLNTGARGATMTFTQQGLGDVLVTWENEAHLALEEEGGDALEIIFPSLSILAEPPVTWVDNTVDKKGSKEAAKRYLAFLYTAEGQRIGAKYFFRPIDPVIAKEYHKQFPSLRMLEIEKDFGGWQKAQKEHFDDGGTFDTIYEHKSH